MSKINNVNRNPLRGISTQVRVFQPQFTQEKKKSKKVRGTQQGNISRVWREIGIRIKLYATLTG